MELTSPHTTADPPDTRSEHTGFNAHALELPPPSGRQLVPWAMAAVVLSFAAQTMAYIVLAVIWTVGGGEVTLANDEVSVAFTAAATALLPLTGIAVVWGCSRLIGWRAPDLGVRTLRRPWRAVLLGFGVFVAFTAITATWTALTPKTDEEHVVLEALLDDPALWVKAAFAFGAIVSAPIVEELVYRGLLFRALSRFGLWPAAIGSGAIFGAVHASAVPWQSLLPLAVLGIGLALLYHVTGSIIAPIGMHAAFNAWNTGVVLGAPSGTDVEATGEGALLGLGLLAAVLIICALTWPTVRRTLNPTDERGRLA